MVKRFVARLTTSFFEAPWAFKLLIVASILYWFVAGVVAVVTGDTLRIAFLPLTPLIIVLWLMRLRWFWWLIAIGSVFAVITDPLEGRSGWLIAWSVFTFVLVLWPSTYTYVTKRPLPSWVPALPGRSGKPGPQA